MPVLNISTGKIPVVCFSKDNGKAWEETIKFLIGFIVQMLLVVVIVVSDGDGAHVARDVGLAILLHHHRPGGQDKDSGCEMSINLENLLDGSPR